MQKVFHTQGNTVSLCFKLQIDQPRPFAVRNVDRLRVRASLPQPEDQEQDRHGQR